MNEEEYYSENKVVGLIKSVTILFAIAIVLASIFISSEDLTLGIVSGIVGLFSALMLFAIGELIEIMNDIRTNSEHIRDYLEDDED